MITRQEFWLLVRQEKKWWLIPPILALLLWGAIYLFSSSSSGIQPGTAEPELHPIVHPSPSANEK